MSYPSPDYTPKNRPSASVLSVAEKVFALLQRGPAPLSLNPRDLRIDPHTDLGTDIGTGTRSSDHAGAAAVWGAEEPVSLWVLRELVLRRQLPVTVVNRMWALLVAGVRGLGETWTVAAVGMALPALCALAGDLSGPRRRVCVDLDAEILGGFLTGLALARPNAPGLFPFLLRHARHAGLAWVTAQRAAARADPVEHTTLEQLHTPRTSVHPDQVLVELVADGVINGQDAGLIIANRLEGIPDRHLANRERLSYDTVRKRRQRAERRVAAYLHHHSGGLDAHHPTRHPTDRPALGGHSAPRTPPCGAAR